MIRLDSGNIHIITDECAWKSSKDCLKPHLRLARNLPFETFLQFMIVQNAIVCFRIERNHVRIFKESLLFAFGNNILAYTKNLLNSWRSEEKANVRNAIIWLSTIWLFSLPMQAIRLNCWLLVHCSSLCLSHEYTHLHLAQKYSESALGHLELKGNTLQCSLF